MKKIILFGLIVLLLILMGILFFLSSRNYLTGEVIESDYYSYTKAICNETNYCQDYEITCKDKELISKILITGANIQHPLNWKDPRNKTNNLCG